MTKTATGAVGSVEIKGAKVRDIIFCDYSYDHNLPGGVTNAVKVKGGVATHPDLRSGFEALNPHLAVVCEEVEASDIYDITNLSFGDTSAETVAKLEKFSVVEFRIDGTGDKAGVILVGTKQLSTGASLKLEAPKLKFDDSDYRFSTELYAAVEYLREELRLYMSGAKKGDLEQLELFESAPGAGEDGEF